MGGRTCGGAGGAGGRELMRRGSEWSTAQHSAAQHGALGRPRGPRPGLLAPLAPQKCRTALCTWVSGIRTSTPPHTHTPAPEKGTAQQSRPPTHHVLCGGHIFHAPARQLRPLVCVQPPAVGPQRAKVLHRHLIHQLAHVAHKAPAGRAGRGGAARRGAAVWAGRARSARECVRGAAPRGRQGNGRRTHPCCLSPRPGGYA